MFLTPEHLMKETNVICETTASRLRDGDNHRRREILELAI